jgi:hypothetical protein
VANRPKIAGTDAENKARDFFKENGWPHADRLTLSGVNDRGDVRLGDGVGVTIEVKGGQKAVSALHSHVKELREEMHNNVHSFGAVIAKKPGSTKVGEDWIAAMPVAVYNNMILLMREHNLI